MLMFILRIFGSGLVFGLGVFLAFLTLDGILRCLDKIRHNKDTLGHLQRRIESLERKVGGFADMYSLPVDEKNKNV